MSDSRSRWRTARTGTIGLLKSDWWSLLEDELGRPHLIELLAFVDANGAGVYPAKEDVFRALELTPLRHTKAVIVGQDPYRPMSRRRSHIVLRPHRICPGDDERVGTRTGAALDGGLRTGRSTHAAPEAGCPFVTGPTS
jgi:hypothetical protein